MSTADSRFHLTEEQRAALRHRVDPRKLERLLARLPAAAREPVLGVYSRGLAARNASALVAPGELPGRVVVHGVRFDDPELQSLVDEIEADIAQDPRFEHYRLVGLPARQASILLIAPSTWPYGNVAAVLHRLLDPAPQDRILVNSTRIDPAGLHAALEDLVAERIRAGIVPPEQLLRPVAAEGQHMPDSPSLMRLLATTLCDLFDSAETEIGGVGKGRSREHRIIP